MLGGLPEEEIDALLKLHPLLRDHDLRVWRYGGHVVTLVDLVARIVSRDTLRIHLGEMSHEDGDDMSRDRFHSGFELSDDLIVIPRYRPGHQGWRTELAFPWFLGVAPIDYQSRLEAQMTRHRGSFEKDEEDDAVVAEVDGIEIRRSLTLYRRIPTG